MRVAVVSSQIAFVHGGAEALAAGLCAALREHGHEAALVTMPFHHDPPAQVIDSIHAAERWRIERADRVIALKFPVYFVPHEDKVVWLLHQHRPVHDLWQTRWSGVRANAEGTAMREMVLRADRAGLAAADRILTTSKVTQRRLLSSTGVSAEILRPPLPRPGDFRSGPFGSYVLSLGRITTLKRQRLVVEAMRHVSCGRVVVVGGGISRRERVWLEALVGRHRLGDRVRLVNRPVTHAEKLVLLSGATAVVNVPFDEDCHGLVALEAAASGKPTITCTDSGGTLEFATDGVTAVVVPPDPRAIGEAIDRLLRDPARAEARRLGEAARDRLGAPELAWSRAVARLMR